MMIALFLSMLVLTQGLQAQSQPVCPVLSIHLPAEQFQNGVGVRPSLRGIGVSGIYIPRRRGVPPAFRVEPSSELPGLCGGLSIVAVEVPTRSLIYPSLAFRFDESDLVPISWKDVEALPSRSDTLVVPAGNYRLALEYSVSDPAQNESPIAVLCKIYSPPFTLRNETTWRRFE